MLYCIVLGENASGTKGFDSGNESAVEMWDLILAESQHSGAQIPHL